MKQVPLRRFTTVVPYLTEPVTITQDGQPIGRYLPIAQETVAMDDIANKAIKPDQVKQQPDGKLSKGLGELPGGDPAHVVETGRVRTGRGLAPDGAAGQDQPPAGADRSRASQASYGTGRPAPKPKK